MGDLERRRHARREFIRARHPDRGGDPAAFTAGLAELDLTQTPAPPVRVVLITRQPLLLRQLQKAARRIRRRRPPPRAR